MITICTDSKHEDIVHEGRECPLCKALTYFNDVVAENKQLTEEVENMQEELKAKE